jgi:hypothetical protein
VRELLATFEATDVVLDFSNVTFLDSAGIGVGGGERRRSSLGPRG